ncbi:helix-turn-helix domain-containing protein [Paraclostridium dentum]|uniref:helix-turn-helix domain-containing protein n=1 Tax=Paraclostridium dentum TaxID=2662455 RepID=UPI003464A9FB
MEFRDLQIKEGEPLLMDVQEVQKLLRIGKTKTYEIIKKENIPHIRLGRQIKVLRQGLYEWIANQINNNQK